MCYSLCRLEHFTTLCSKEVILAHSTEMLKTCCSVDSHTTSSSRSQVLSFSNIILTCKYSLNYITWNPPACWFIGGGWYGCWLNWLAGGGPPYDWFPDIGPMPPNGWPWLAGGDLGSATGWPGIGPYPLFLLMEVFINTHANKDSVLMDSWFCITAHS